MGTFSGSGAAWAVLSSSSWPLGPSSSLLDEMAMTATEGEKKPLGPSGALGTRASGASFKLPGIGEGESRGVSSTASETCANLQALGLTAGLKVLPM